MKGQNRSSAVMQQRQEARDALDDFPTPMWATRALCEFLEEMQIDLSVLSVREPCANRGYMVRALEEYFATVQASDVHDYGAGYEVLDYLFGPSPAHVNWTVMNPPFRLAAQFIERAFHKSSGVAVFVRSAFLEGGERYASIFSQNPPDLILQFCERVVIHKGAMRQAGEKYYDPEANNGEGKWKAASSATAYCWLVWLPVGIPDRDITRFEWIGPCRRAYERDGDYEPLGDL